MDRRIAGTVKTILSERDGYQEVAVLVDANPGGTNGGICTVQNVVALTGRVSPGDDVTLRVGVADYLDGVPPVFITEGPDSRTQDGIVPSAQRPGHVQASTGERIPKLRCTPMEIPVAAAELPDSPHHTALRMFASLDDTPVVCAELHSHLPAICAAAHWSLDFARWPRPPRIAYIMTDSAGLPLSMSPYVQPLKAANLLTATITAGQAFGGDYEAVNTYSALAIACEVVRADIIVVSQGVGHIGTGTPLGFTGIDQGLSVNAAASLGGVAIVVPRISFEEARTRHRGLSHHTVTILNRVVRANTLVPIPNLPDRQLKLLYAAFETTGVSEAHEVVRITAEPGLAALMSLPGFADLISEEVTSEAPHYLTAAAAGMLAAQLVEVRQP